MNKYINYFYFISKISTSIFLLIVIILLSYMFYTSYKETDSLFIEFDKSNTLLKKSIEENTQNISNIINSVEQNVILANKIKLKTQEEFNKKIKDLTTVVNEINSKISKLNINSIRGNNNSYKYKDQETKLTLNLILTKYKNGEAISSELLLLEKFIHRDKLFLLEKLQLLETNKFYGLKKLKEEFNVALSAFVKESFLDLNEESILNYLLSFITIKSGNSDIFKNENLNILRSARDYLYAEDITNSLEKVLLIRDNNNFFIDWKHQSNKYLEFQSIIKEMI